MSSFCTNVLSSSTLYSCLQNRLRETLKEVFSAESYCSAITAAGRLSSIESKQSKVKQRRGEAHFNITLIHSQVEIA
jgi:hypothetical protein